MVLLLIIDVCLIANVSLFFILIWNRWWPTFLFVSNDHLLLTGIGSAWHLSFVEVVDASSGSVYTFYCDKWLSKSNDDGQIIRELICSEKQSSNAKKKTGKSFNIQQMFTTILSSPGGNTQQSSSCTTTYHPSWKLSKLDKPDMQDTVGEVGMSS